jgi:hypothetical protein
MRSRSSSGATQRIGMLLTVAVPFDSGIERASMGQSIPLRMRSCVANQPGIAGM